MTDHLDHPILTEAQEKRLIARVRKGSQGYNKIQAKRARDELVMHNQRLVYKTAMRYQFFGLPLDDLIQEGNVALLQAIDAFEPERYPGVGLAGYAKRRINTKIQRAVMTQLRAVQVPTKVQEKALRIQRLARELASETGYTPSVDEVARYTSESPELVEFALSDSYNKVLSLDRSEVVGGEESSPLVEDVASDEAGPEDMAVQMDAKQESAEGMLEALSGLKDEPRDALLRTRVGGQDLKSVAREQGRSYQGIQHMTHTAACRFLDALLGKDADRERLEALGLRNSYVVRVQARYAQFPTPEDTERTIGYFSREDELGIRRSLSAIIRRDHKTKSSSPQATQRVYCVRKFPRGELITRLWVDSEAKIKPVPSEQNELGTGKATEVAAL